MYRQTTCLLSLQRKIGAWISNFSIAKFQTTVNIEDSNQTRQHAKKQYTKVLSSWVSWEKCLSLIVSFLYRGDHLVLHLKIWIHDLEGSMLRKYIVLDRSVLLYTKEFKCYSLCSALSDSYFFVVYSTLSGTYWKNE